MNFGLRTPNRRGLSDIVTSVLIILLVLIAIGIIWAFLRPFIVQGGNEVSSTTQCLNYQLDVVSCDYSLPYVRAHLKRGATTGDLGDALLIFEDSTGNRQTISWNQSAGPHLELPEPLEIKENVFQLGEGFVPLRVTASAQLSDGTICAPLGDIRTCIEHPLQGIRCADYDDGSFTGTPDEGITNDDLLYYLFIYDARDYRADRIGCTPGSIVPDGDVNSCDLVSFLHDFEEGLTDGCP